MKGTGNRKALLSERRDCQRLLGWVDGAACPKTVTATWCLSKGNKQHSKHEGQIITATVTEATAPIPSTKLQARLPCRP